MLHHLQIQNTSFETCVFSTFAIRINMFRHNSFSSILARNLKKMYKQYLQPRLLVEHIRYANTYNFTIAKSFVSAVLCTLCTVHTPKHVSTYTKNNKAKKRGRFESQTKKLTRKS